MIFLNTLSWSVKIAGGVMILKSTPLIKMVNERGIVKTVNANVFSPFYYLK